MKQGTLEKIQNLAVSLQLVTVEDMRKHSLPQLVTMIANKMNELIQEVYRFEGEVSEVVKSQNDNIQYLLGEGLHLEVATVFEKWVNDGTFDTLINHSALKTVNERIDEINLVLSKKQFKTPEEYGCKGDGVTDDSQNFLTALNECMNHGYVLSLKGKYNLATSIIFEPWQSLMVIGSRPNYNNLTSDSLLPQNEQCDIIFSNDATLEINKMGSVTFLGVGFSSTSKQSKSSIIIKSFHNKFINCSFSQFGKAISLLEGAKNWCGENQVLNSVFHKCGTAYHSESGSDSDFDGNVIHGSCDIGFYGLCAGYKINNNHFYNQQPNTFKFFNTSIENNYFEEIANETNGGIILDGRFGVKFNNNMIFLREGESRSQLKGLVGVILQSGGTGIMFDGNTVHGRSATIIPNLCFIDIIYTGTRPDVTMNIGNNNLRSCQAIFTKYQPYYNVNGTHSYSIERVDCNGTILDKKVNIVNGWCQIYYRITPPNYANMLKLNNLGDIPTVVKTRQKKTNGTYQMVDIAVKAGEFVSLSNYAELSEVEFFAMYQVQHRPYPQYIPYQS